MSLSEMINEVQEGENTSSENNSNNDLLDEIGNLFKFSSVTYNKDKLHKDNICPSCGSSNTEKHKYYWRCKSENCKVVTYHTT